MSELNIKIRKLQDNGSTFRATPESLYMGGVGSAKVDTLCFDVPEEWKGCAITLHVQRLSGTLPGPQLLDEKNRAVVDQRWTKEKQGLWMLMAVGADGYTAMTKPGRYTCYETIDRDSTTEAITPSVYEQFVALVKKETAEANRAAKNAAASAEIAKSFESTITATGEQVQREITATADQTKQAIDEKAKAALASIPEDYTALSESVGQVNDRIGDYSNKKISLSSSQTSVGLNWNIILCEYKKGTTIKATLHSYNGSKFSNFALLLYKADGTFFRTSTSVIGKEISITITDDVTNGYLQINRTAKEYDVEAEYTLNSVGGYNVYSDLSRRINDVLTGLNDYVKKDGIELVTLDNLQDFTSLNKCNLGVGCIDGKVLNTEKPSDNASYFYTNPMYGFEIGKTYAVKRFNPPAHNWQVFITFWKADGTYNGNKFCGTYDGMSYNFTVPVGTAYIKVSATLVSKGHIMIEESTVSSGVYEDYGAVIHSKKPLEAENIPHVFHVKKDGSGDFNKLIDAIEYAEKWMDSVVYIGDGTWDLLSELGSEYVESASYSKRGIYLKNRIHLIGSSRSLITAHYNGSNQQTKTWLSPFNSGEYGFTLENITLETSNLRYSIHDERDTSAEPYTNKYIDCNFKTDNSHGGLRQCIGGGLGRDGHIFIRGCIFNSVTANHNSAVSYHNTWYRGGTGKSFIDIQNSVVKGTGTFRFSWFGDSTEMTQVLCANNSIGSQIQFVQESTDTSLGVAVDIVNMELFAWNNEVRAS